MHEKLCSCTSSSSPDTSTRVSAFFPLEYQFLGDAMPYVEKN